MRRSGLVVKLKIVAEHGEQVLFQPHHQRVHPAVEDDIGPFESHLRRVPGGKVLDVDRRRDHRAGHAETLRDVALHLRAEDELRVQGSSGRLDFKVIVGDQRLEAVLRSGSTNLSCAFAAVGTQPNDREAQFVPGYPRSSDGVCRVTEDEYPLPGEVRRVNGPRVPRRTGRRADQVGRWLDAREPGHFSDEFPCCTNADGNHRCHGLAAGLFQPLRSGPRHFRVQHDVEIGLAKPAQVRSTRAERRHDMNVDADLPEQPRDLRDVVAMPETEGRRPEDVAERSPHRRGGIPRGAGPRRDQ